MSLRSLISLKLFMTIREEGRESLIDLQHVLNQNQDAVISICLQTLDPQFCRLRVLPEKRGSRFRSGIENPRVLGVVFPAAQYTFRERHIQETKTSLADFRGR